jgi:hypothetical protein
MNMTPEQKLRQYIREILQEELSTVDETSQAAKDAKAQGLTNMGFGRWGKDGHVTHISDKGKLVKFSPAAIEKKTGMTFGTDDHNKNTLYRNGNAKATMPEPGKLVTKYSNKDKIGSLRHRKEFLRQNSRGYYYSKEPLTVADRAGTSGKDRMKRSAERVVNSMNSKMGTGYAEPNDASNTIKNVVTTYLQKNPMAQPEDMASIPTEEFKKLTGFNEKQMKAYTQYHKKLRDDPGYFQYDDWRDSNNIKLPLNQWTSHFDWKPHETSSWRKKYSPKSGG